MKAPVLKPYFRLARGLVTARRPVYLHFAVTHRCNLRCRMCAAWRLADEDHEVRIQEIRRIAAAFARLGCALVSLGGGEPFLREDLPDVIAAFAVEGIRVRVLTNGVAPDTATLRRAFAAGLADVSISLDSLEPRVQGLIDGDPDSLHRKLDTLAALLGMLPPRGSRPLLNTVVSRFNLDEIPSLVAFAADTGCLVSLIPIHLAAVQDHDRFHGAASEMAITPQHHARVGRLYAWLLGARRRGAPIINSTAFLMLSREFLCGRVDRFQCDAGRLYFSLSPFGTLSICHDTEGVEDLAVEELPALLQDPSYEERRHALIARCNGCVRPCWAEITFLAHDRLAFLQALPLAPRRRHRLPVSVHAAAARYARGSQAAAGRKIESN